MSVLKNIKENECEISWLMSIWVLHFLVIVISAIAVINEAVDKEDHQSTLQALQAVAAKLSGIVPENSQLYQKLLYTQKMAKAVVRMDSGYF